MTDFSATYPLHYLTWNNQSSLITEYLTSLKSQASQSDSNFYKSHLEKRDNKGRTPLHLAISLGHLESMQALLSAGADINIENTQKWSALQEAISTGDPEIVSKALQYRLYQRTVGELSCHSKAYSEFIQSDDFYVEIKWEVTSWIPLVSALFAPNDILKIWKVGHEIRIDNSLVGFESLRWIKGHRTTLINFLDENSMKVTIIDHDKQEAVVTYSESAINSSRRIGVNSRMFRFSEDHVAKRLTEPTCDSLIDFDGCSINKKTIKPGYIFNRNAIETDKIDDVCGYKAVHYHVDGVRVVTRKRTEHLENGDEKKAKESVVETFISKLKSNSRNSDSSNQDAAGSNFVSNPQNLTADEYFSLDKNSVEDVGRPVKVSTKSHNVQLNMWLVDQNEYPLDLKSQVRPLIEIASISNPHFSRLKLFFDDLLPPGVPIKTEIPLFNLVTARCIVEKTTKLNDETVPDKCFEVPEGYEKSGDLEINRRGHRRTVTNQDLNSEMQYQTELQMAIQQSLNVGTEENNQARENTDDELERVLRQSLYEQ